MRGSGFAMRLNRALKENPSNYRKMPGKSINLLKRTFICVLIMVSVLGIKKIDMMVTNKITESISYLITYNYDFVGALSKSPFSGFIKENLKLDIIKNHEPVVSNNTLTFRLPVTGSVVSTFGPRIHPIYNIERQHNGIDIDAEKGTEITAVMEGKVKTAGFDHEMGNVICIEHGGGLETVYGHCDKVFVKTGQEVLDDQVIATVGETGITSGPHLHFEVWLDGEPVDPMNFIKQPS